MTDDIVFREATQDEMDSLVRSSWCKTFGAPNKPHGMSRWLWYRVLWSGVTDVIASSKVLVCHLDGIDAEVLGWICWDSGSEEHEPTIHYLWVKPYARRRGIGTSLLRVAESACSGKIQYSHRTRDGHKLLDAEASQMEAQGAA